MTGSLLVAVYALLPLVLPDSPGRKTTYLWNHLPPWLGVTLAVLALFVAQYHAWVDLRRDKEQGTRVLASLHIDGPYLLLKVKNLSSKLATFRVALSKPDTLFEMKCRWADTNTVDLALMSGESRDALVAELFFSDERNRAASWNAPSRNAPSRLIGASFATDDVPAEPDSDAAQLHSLDLEVALLSSPSLENEFKRVVRLVWGRVYEKADSEWKLVGTILR
jgi:hypothetical protein